MPRSRLLALPPGDGAEDKGSRRFAMVLMIDNYDSFTWNLVQYFGELGEDVARRSQRRHDARGARKARARGDRRLAGSVYAERGGHLARSHREARRTRADLRRLPRPSGDRAGVRRQGRAREGNHARQDLDDSPRRQGCVQGRAESVRGDALSLARRRAVVAARCLEVLGVDGRRRRPARRNHGTSPHLAAGRGRGSFIRNRS